MPGVGRWRSHPIRPRKNPENIFFQRLAILWTLDTGSQLLGDDDAEVFEWREHAMQLLQSVVRTRVAKRPYEELRV